MTTAEIPAQDPASEQVADLGQIIEQAQSAAEMTDTVPSHLVSRYVFRNGIKGLDGSSPVFFGDDGKEYYDC